MKRMSESPASYQRMYKVFSFGWTVMRDGGGGGAGRGGRLWAETNAWGVPRARAAWLAVQLQIEEVSRKLRSGDLGIPANVEERCVTRPAADCRLPAEVHCISRLWSGRCWEEKCACIVPSASLPRYTHYIVIRPLVIQFDRGIVSL